MLFKEYCKSLKVPKYNKNVISDRTKVCIDEMLEQNISWSVIVGALNITEQQFNEYLNNEWCYKNPDKYFNFIWVQWVNLFAEDFSKSKQKSL